MSFERRIALLAVLMAGSLQGHAELIFEDSGESLAGLMLIDEARGERVGANLLHSFASFNVRAGELALFRGDDAIETVIERVTGSDLSVINGQLRSDIADADLSILNPNGVLFGDSAQMFVDGAL